MPKILNDFLSAQFVKFLISGGIAALVNFLVRLFLSQWLSYSLSIVLAYLCGMVVAFLLYEHEVFAKSKIPLKIEIMRFVLVTALAILQTLVVSLVLADHFFPSINMTFYPQEIAHIIGMGVPVFTSFLGHKYFTFER